MDLPTISIVIPTLNSAKTIGQCLQSISRQDYPRDKLEIIIADGGSRDGTLDLVKKELLGFSYQIIINRLQTGEAGKAAGVMLAKNDIVALIDSDNLLPEDNWLRLMAGPFSDSQIAASEPLFYTYRREDGLITRYCALLGMNDPLCLFLGNYDRYCLLTDSWTGLPFFSTDQESFLKIRFSPGQQLPTIGANGFLIRRHILQRHDFADYLFDIDIICDLAAGGNQALAKVKTGIIHLFSGNLGQFIRKQQRRIKDYNYYKEKGLRKYNWERLNLLGLVKFCLYSIFIFPLLFQALTGYFKKRDRAWFFHIPACYLSFFIYAWGTIKKTERIASRDSWQQD